MEDLKLKLIIASRIKWLEESKEDGKNHDEDFGEEIGNLFNDGTLKGQDLIDLHDQSDIKGPALAFIIAPFIKREGHSMTYGEARALGYRIQPIYFSYHHVHKGRMDGDNLFRESIKTYENAIDDIYNGIYPEDKLQILKSLPNPVKGEWNHELAIEAYHKIFN